MKNEVEKMIKNSCSFEVGKLEKLEAENFKIEPTENGLYFLISGTDLNSNNYSIDFFSTTTFDEMIKFELNKVIDFTKYVDLYDISFGINGIYNLDINIKMEIIRYLDRSFILNISFNIKQKVFGRIELSFSI